MLSQKLESRGGVFDSFCLIESFGTPNPPGFSEKRAVLSLVVIGGSVPPLSAGPARLSGRHDPSSDWLSCCWPGLRADLLRSVRLTLN